VGPTADPPMPYDTEEVAGLVRWGTEAGQLTQTASGTEAVYCYIYDEAAGGQTYHSPILHHVRLTALQPGQTYFYRVGEGQGEGGEVIGALCIRSTVHRNAPLPSPVAPLQAAYCATAAPPPRAASLASACLPLRLCR
jgi:hypothetical protein